MENEVKQRNQRNRRRERAQRMQAQRESKVKDGDSGEDESPAREKPPRPPARRKKSREPLGEEDIIDGFAIMAFRTYEDLEAAVKCASSPRTNALSTKPRLPLAALPGDPARNHPPNNVNSHGITLLQDAGTSDDSGRASERLTGSSVAPRDPDSSRDRLSDASSRCSSGKGYICDSEGDDDKASPESRNPSPRYHDVSMDDASDAGSLFRVTGAGGGGAAKNELVARGGSGGALALSRAPVGGSASPAPAPLPQPAPSPAPAALPPPALPPPTFRADTPHRANGAHIPAHDGHAATQLPARPIGAAGPDTPERPAGHKLQPGARAAADSPTPAPPAPPAPSPLFPYAAHAAAALPDFRHTNHETRTEPPGAPLDLHAPPAPRPPPPASHPVLPGQDVRPRAAPPAAPPAAPQPPPAAPSLPEPPRPYPAPSIPSSQVNSSVGSGSHHAVPYQPSLQKHSAQPPYAGRPPHLAPFSVASHLAPASSASQPHPASSHSTTSHAPYAHAPAPSYSSALAPGMISSFTAIPPKPALAPADAPISTARVPNGFAAPLFAPAYPPLYAPYSATLHSPYLPPAAASPRNVSDTRTSLSSSPLVAPKTPKGVRPHTPGSTGAAGAPLAPLSYSPSPARERENFSNISSMSRSTPVSAASAPVSAPPPLVPPLSAPLAAPIAAPLTAPLSAPLPGPLPAPLAAPLSTSLSGPLPTPLSAPLAPPPLSAGLSSLGAPLPAIGAPLATPTPTAPAASHPLAHSLAPVPTVPSISSGSKPPAHWGSTRPPGPERTSFAPAPPLFGAPLPPPNPNPFSAESLFQTSPGADLLRRELDNRFLAAAGAVGANVGATSVRTEMHHHQHQHTHVHQHPPPHHHQLLVPHPPLFKDVAKMPSLYRTGLGLGYPYSSGLLHPTAPYVPPAPITSYAPKPVVSSEAKPPRPPHAKTGKWNAMHVRIAWEIYNHQQKEKSSGAGALPPPADKDKLRAFPAAPAPPPPYRSPYELAPYLHHAPLGVSPFARYGAAYPPAPPAFPLSAYGLPALHAHALHDAWRARPPLAAERRDLDERARRERDERERRERDERRKRELERGRARSPLRAPDKDERKEPPRAPPLAYAPPPWDPYRFDPLQHMRFAPLVEAAIRAEEDRAKMLSAYAHQQLKAPLLHRAPVDLLKKEEPR